ncbi:proline-rich receptor-like protein kinase PERK10 [Portunus trituberculatus]|uniref:proline-rich receptor-like protein kinase PERK10 n=1 Tax=Portunus trituberculatus TaxID=210409 RepID=UPI001E1CC986|nr:proline-rich receptor-like protein kinase PERK10 [Portunus trituberculatus]
MPLSLVSKAICGGKTAAAVAAAALDDGQPFISAWSSPAWPEGGGDLLVTSSPPPGIETRARLKQSTHESTVVVSRAPNEPKPWQPSHNAYGEMQPPTTPAGSNITPSRKVNPEGLRGSYPATSSPPITPLKAPPPPHSLPLPAAHQPERVILLGSPTLPLPLPLSPSPPSRSEPLPSQQPPQNFHLFFPWQARVFTGLS